VAGSFEYCDVPAGSGAAELVIYNKELGAG
jgi:hypothetical protein